MKVTVVTAMPRWLPLHLCCLQAQPDTWLQMTTEMSCGARAKEAGTQRSAHGASHLMTMVSRVCMHVGSCAWVTAAVTTTTAAAAAAVVDDAENGQGCSNH